MNISNWNWSQIVSVIGAVLAILVGVAGLALGWFGANGSAEGLGLIFAGLAVLGVHTGGPVAGNTHQ